jgi:hypothetical protein
VSFFKAPKSSLPGAAASFVAVSVAPETTMAPRNPRRLVVELAFELFFDMMLSPSRPPFTC